VACPLPSFKVNEGGGEMRQQSPRDDNGDVDEDMQACLGFASMADWNFASAELDWINCHYSNFELFLFSFWLKCFNDLD
jgi:hypothetical protein